MGRPPRPDRSWGSSKSREKLFQGRRLGELHAVVTPRLRLVVKTRIIRFKFAERAHLQSLHLNRVGAKSVCALARIPEAILEFKVIIGVHNHLICAAIFAQHELILFEP